MTDQPEKLDLTSHNLPADKTAELLRLFPEIRTEGDKIDFDKLKLVLGQTVDVGKERYGMTWAGKADCFKTIQAPSTGTLLPAPEESVDFDTTENLIIEGDNLNVLKLLQKAYLGKVKMIYIDPPYNTGNDFIYPDNYTESLQTYLEYTGQVDAEGRKFGTNTDTDGRYHSRWMNMMYPRLYLARNLLRDDGVIFINIDDVEVTNLRKLCDEIFGEENFIADIIWEKRFTRNNDAKLMSSVFDHTILYRKSDALAYLREPRNEKTDSIYTNPDNDPRGPWTSVSYISQRTKDERPNLSYTIINPITKQEVDHPTNSWKYSKEQYEFHSKDNRLYWGGEGNNQYPRLKRFLSELDEGVVPINLWEYKETGTIDDGTKIVDTLIGKDIFNYPKPPSLLIRMMKMALANVESPIVLDFFAGSGTTGHAVIEINKEDYGNRKFILVQLPEPCGKETESGKAGYKTIADITKERVRRIIKKLNDEEAGQLPMGNKQDRGFRVFKLAESNFKGWDASVPKDGSALAQQLELHIDHIREGRTSEDILYEVLLKSGFPLTTPVEKIELVGKAVYSVAGGGMLICLEKELTLEVIRAMAEKKPQRVICLDLGFVGNDQLKANAVQIFKTKEVVFKTV
ncbi:MAG: site-specific DNA-methyltransferase [Chloroflexi bacterium]|nr:site-specific DNA-methyltransferase [Chloroflexota bacterium]NOG74307.1 site-specific DNA-methyltransferase [Chloroflexota bacterium]WKZ55526.1 MAG: site-specific DNA-methyltransferase [Anaerolineales bacterium]GIK09062.1 MAG: DNA methylase N-4 [Chloroflexota bacterium]GJQ37302.1 MAG: DNA methylase N-4 [Anaerolineaceae bacterium]